MARVNPDDGPVAFNVHLVMPNGSRTPTSEIHVVKVSFILLIKFLFFNIVKFEKSNIAIIIFIIIIILFFLLFIIIIIYFLLLIKFTLSFGVWQNYDCSIPLTND